MLIWTDLCVCPQMLCDQSQASQAFFLKRSTTLFLKCTNMHTHTSQICTSLSKPHSITPSLTSSGALPMRSALPIIDDATKASIGCEIESLMETVRLRNLDLLLNTLLFICPFLKLKFLSIAVANQIYRVPPSN